MNEPVMSRLVELTHHGIAYRAYPWSQPAADGAIKWQIEYQQNPKDPYWGARGTFTEKDGVFHIDGVEADSPRQALSYFVVN